MADERVLEVDQPLVAAVEQHDVLGMVIAQHGHAGILPRQHWR